MPTSNFVLHHPTGISVSAEPTESKLLHFDSTANDSKLDMQTGWVWYNLPPFLDQETLVAIALGFNKGILELVTISDQNSKYGVGWAEWSEEKEHLRASSIGSWLAAKGFAAGSYAWGGIWVGYDPKGGFGSAAVKLAA